ncbi:MAG: flagellar basal body rod protein FlgB [Candidatus Sericytochromatia bacterium]
MLDVTTLRHRTIANNVANINTPGFNRSDVSFKEALERIKSSANEDGPDMNAENQVRGINDQLLQNLTMDSLYAEGQRHQSDLGVGYSLTNTTFDRAFAEHPAAGADSLDPRAAGPKAMSRADFISNLQPEIMVHEDAQRQDGNTINPEVEMASMIQNTSFYNVLVSSLSGEFRTLKTIISNR